MQKQPSEFGIVRNFNKHNINDFKTELSYEIIQSCNVYTFRLSYEIWDTIFGDNDVNKILNNFHKIF